MLGDRPVWLGIPIYKYDPHRRQSEKTCEGPLLAQRGLAELPLSYSIASVLEPYLTLPSSCGAQGSDTTTLQSLFSDLGVSPLAW
jgi:hypothetical protein